MNMMNRLWNVGNPAQGSYKKVLCCCSAGLLRSPTAALVLSQEPFNYNTRAAGVHSYALVPVDRVLLEWADEVVCMEREHEKILLDMGCEKPIVCLEMPDSFHYRDPELMKLIAEAYKDRTKK